MGKRGGGWQPDTSKWRLWGGAKSPSQRPWRSDQAYQDTRFPAFDAEYVDLQENGRAIAKRELEADGLEDSTSGMLQSLQTVLNAARKAEGRVARACKAREQTKAQWLQFDEKLKAAYQKERKRFELAMHRHEKEVAEARDAQAAAREMIRAAHPMTAANEPAPMLEDDMEWEKMKAKWDAEQGKELGDVYRRAMAATFEVAPATPMRPGVPAMRTQGHGHGPAAGAGNTAASPSAISDPVLEYGACYACGQPHSSRHRQCGGQALGVYRAFPRCTSPEGSSQNTTPYAIRCRTGQGCGGSRECPRAIPWREADGGEAISPTTLWREAFSQDRGDGSCWQWARWTGDRRRRPGRVRECGAGHQANEPGTGATGVTLRQLSIQDPVICLAVC